MKLVAIALILATPVNADGHVWNTSTLSVLTASSTAEKGCVMAIDIDNHDTDVLSRSIGVLGVDGIGVHATYYRNAGPWGAERYEFTPPDGYIAVPTSLYVTDGKSARVLICPVSDWLGY